MNIFNRRFNIKGSAIVSLAKIGDIKAVPKLIELFNDKESQPNFIRAGVIEKLHSFKDDRVVDTLLSALEENNIDVQSWAINSIKELKSKRTLPSLLKIAKNSDLSVTLRCKSINAIGSLNQPEAVPHLVALLDSLDEDILLHTISALGDLVSYSSLKPLIEVASNKDKYPGQVRRSATSALRKIADNTVLNDIIALVDDPYSPVVSEAIRVLAEIGGPKSGEIMLNIIDNHLEYPPDVIAVTILSLGKMKHSKAGEKIIPFMLDNEELETVRKASVISLGAIRTTRATEALKSMSMNDSVIAATAREALFSKDDIIENI